MLTRDSFSNDRNIRTKDGNTDIYATDAKSRSQLQSTNKRTLQRQIIHQTFNEASSYTDDEFWKYKLNMAARGKFPRGFFFRDGFLCLKKKNKIQSVQIPDNPADVVNSFITFIQSTGIYSNIDSEYQKEQTAFLESTTSSGSPLTWSQVPKNMRNDYIDDYVEKICKEIGYNKEIPEHRHVRRSLNDSIRVGIHMKIFDKDTINLGYYCIESINGLVFNPNTNQFGIDDDMWRRSYNIYVNKPDVSQYGSELAPHPMYSPSGTKFRSSWNKLAREYRKEMSSKKGIQSSRGFGELIIIEDEHEMEDNSIIA